MLLLVFAQLALGQNPYYYVIDKSKGLPSNSVYDIFQDRVGYMWFATDEGLCRYNGTTFKSYFSEQQTSRAGSCISQDKYGRIWYSNFDGYLYYVKDGKLHALSNKKPKGYFRYGIINDFLYLVAEQGIVIYDLKTLKQVKHLKIDEDILHFANVANDKFYVLGSALYEIGGGKLLQKISLPPDFYQHLQQAIIMQPTPQGMLFLSKVSNGNYLMSSGTFVKQYRPKDIDFIQNTSYNAEGLWLCNPKGAYLLNKTVMSLHSQAETYNTYFTAFNISYVFKDNRGNSWFSTLNSGLLLVPNLRNTLLEVQPRPITIHTTKQDVVISTENECIYKINLANYHKDLLYKGNSNHAINQLFVDSLTGKIMFTSNKFVILNEKHAIENQTYVAVKDVKQVDKTYYTFAASGYSGLFKVHENNTKSIWDSLYLNNSRKAINLNFKETELFAGINGKATVYNGKNKTLYYATNVGLFYRTPLTQGELKFNHTNLYIRKLETYNGTVYGLTTNGKLFAVDSLNRIEQIQLKVSRHFSFASKIKVIGNFLYIIVSSSVYEYNLVTKKITNVINLGLDFEVSDMGLYNHQFVFATAKGVLLQHRNISKPKNYTSLVLEGVMVNDSLVTASELVNLKYNQNNIDINYSLLAYTPHENYPIYYKVNEGKWQQLNEHSGSLKLNSLSPGVYRISFKLVTDKEYLQEVSFVIAKPFWLSTFFLLGITLLLLAVVYIVYRYKIAQNNKENQLKLARINLEKNLNLSKLKAIKSQMNPHFFYNALNTIQSYILDSDKKQAVGYLSKFSALTRTILEMSENEYINLNEEIKMIGFYLDIEKARFSEDFDYSIQVNGIGMDEEVRIPSLLLQPYIENAIKHGLLHKEGAKELQIIFERDEDILKVIIDDNGIGRQKSAQLNQIKNSKHQSFATEAIQNRIDLLNQGNECKITIAYIDKIGVAGNALGTTVTIEIPLTDKVI